MKNYVFLNKGVMDPRSIKTFGVSSKEGDSPIGYFGTGLKYAIAVLLREGCQIEINSGGNRYEFTAVEAPLRAHTFKFVHMNGEPLAFTTELGKNWEVWQAFRELACNAIDEKGTMFVGNDFTMHDKDSTAVIVTGDKFAHAWAQRDQIILPKDTVIDVTDECEVHPGPSEWLYYRGVRCHRLEKPTANLYNVLSDQKLTEDRTFANLFMALWSVEKHVFRNNRPLLIS